LSAKNMSATAAFAQSAATKLLIIGLNAATGIVTARALAPTGRGELSAMILSYSFLACALTLGLPSALTYQLRKKPEDASDLLGAGLVLCLLISGISAIIGFFFLPLWIPQYSPTVLFYARVFLLNTPVALFFLIGRAAVESRNGFSASNFSLFGAPAATLAGLIPLKLMGRLTPVSAAWCYVLPGIPLALWMLVHILRIFKPRFHSFFASVRLLLSYGVRSYGIDLCGTMSLYVDQALVVRLLTPDLMGIYVVALSLSRLLNAFHTSVVMVLFPRAVSRPPIEVLEMTGRAVRITTVLTVVCGLGIVAAGPKLLVMLYGADYRGATGILRILVLEVILSGATQVMSQAFMALGRPGVITALQAIGLSLTIPLMLLMIPKLGLTGAALALLISTCARLTFVLASFPLLLKLPVPDLLVQRKDITGVSQQILRGLAVRRTANAAIEI
jgi:O-antigen/teichoic acid export membrane protein